MIAYLAAQRRAALLDLSHHFDSNPEAVRGMLSVLERKGRVRRLAGATACNRGCGQCEEAATEIYEWIGSSTEG